MDDCSLSNLIAMTGIGSTRPCSKVSCCLQLAFIGLEVIAANKMVDAFGFRDSDGNLTLCYSTFVRVEFLHFSKEGEVESKHFTTMDENYFIMVNCLSVTPIRNGFLCIFGLTNKKLAIYLLNSSSADEEFKPRLLDSREAIWNLDVKSGIYITLIVKRCLGPDDEFSFEILAGTEERVQIWKLETGNLHLKASNYNYSQRE
jgi:hypothetical protein